MLKTKVTAIGDSAISSKDPLIILFGEQATDELRKVSVIHTVVSEKQTVDLHAGGTISFGNQIYTIQHVGSLANANFNAIGHVTLIFSELPDDEQDKIENGLYLSPYKLPNLTEGLEMTYGE